MKKMLGLLGAFGLIASTSASVVSCGGILGDLEGLLSKACYNEVWENVTDKGSNHKQWDDISLLTLIMGFLSKEEFPDGRTLYDKLNHKTSKELEDKLKIENEDGTTGGFHFDLHFTLLITNEYGSINGRIIEEMKQSLISNEETGTYLFLNLANLENIENLQNEPQINFQFLFLTKDENNQITNNENNDWFYWYQYDCINRFFSDKREYFFDLLVYAETKRVVTGTISPQ